MEKLQKNVEKNTGEIVIFKTSENNVSIDVRFCSAQSELGLFYKS